jgi:hypothetical protein
MVNYQLTQENVVTKFYNSLFLAYELADKLNLDREILDKMNTEVICDTKITKNENSKRIRHGYTTNDGKTIVLDGGYFAQVLKRSSRLKKFKEETLQSLFEVCYQFWMDHEFLHSYLTLSGEAEKIWKTNENEKYRRVNYRRKMEAMRNKLQKKFTAYRIEFSKDENTKKIWLYWIRVLSKP